jgi:signal transduction histidine kinase
MSDTAENLRSQPDLRSPLASEAMSVAEARTRIQELTAALVARDSFIALVGHELRNTLAPMVLLAESFGAMAEGSQPPAKVFSRVAMLTGNLNKLIATIGRIVEVSDLRRGKLHLEPTTTDLAAVVEEVCRETRREAAAGGAELVVVGDSVVGRWDRARIKQIVSNLIANAIRYSGGGRIEVSVRSRGSEGEIAIEDQGPGICPDLIPQLFDFAEQGGVRRSGGFGTGLWVVKTLCTAMHGSVTVENRSDGGARFCVVLPRG